jgi:alpha-1,6-mannosyltransferase
VSQPKRQNTSKIIGLLTFTAVVFRSELTLLLGALALQFLATKRISFPRLVKTGLIAGLLSIGKPLYMTPFEG